MPRIKGGAIFIKAGKFHSLNGNDTVNVYITNVLLTNNIGSDDGSSIYLDGIMRVEIFNVTLSIDAFNLTEAKEKKNGIFLHSTGQLRVINTVFVYMGMEQILSIQLYQLNSLIKPSRLTG